MDELFEKILVTSDLATLARANDVSSLATALNAETLTVSVSDLQTIRTIIKSLGIADATAATAGLKAAASSNPLMDSIYTAVSTTGINFADPVTQATIDSLVASGAFSASLGVKLKALGIRHTSLAASVIGRSVTEAEAVDLCNRVKKRDTFDVLRAKFNAVIAYLDLNPTATVAQCVAKFAE